MVLRLVAVQYATNASSDALALAVVGAIGDGAGLEFLTYSAELDLPDPERVLARPDDFQLPKRGDRQLACLTAIVSAVQSRTTRERWEAAWVVLAQAAKAGVPDVAARAAMDLAALRQPDWTVPSTVDAFVDVLRLSGRLR